MSSRTKQNRIALYCGTCVCWLAVTEGCVLAYCPCAQYTGTRPRLQRVCYASTRWSPPTQPARLPAPCSDTVVLFSHAKRSKRGLAALCGNRAGGSWAAGQPCRGGMGHGRVRGCGCGGVSHRLIFSQTPVGAGRPLASLAGCPYPMPRIVQPKPVRSQSAIR